MKLLLLILASLLLVGCDEDLNSRYTLNSEYAYIRVQVIDGCEYIICNSPSGIAHKGNCKNPEHGLINSLVIGHTDGGWPILRPFVVKFSDSVTVSRRKP